ncbi:hypothetical protein HY772_00665 [Candidatus Woesearchaeota archaeon]|nr:hypothetical protein [Candidatus Woesearchaeota archaeon]
MARNKKPLKEGRNKDDRTKNDRTGVLVQKMASDLSGGSFSRPGVEEKIAPPEKGISLDGVVNLLERQETRGHKVGKKGEGKEGGSKESIYTVKQPAIQKTKELSVYFLSEVAYDSFMFNDVAYQNLLNFITNDPAVSGIVIDGALTRLDRPEYLNEELTYWHKTCDEALEENKRVHNNQQYDHMLNKQFETLEKRLREIRDKVPRASQVILSVDSDDLGFTASAILNEKLIRKQGEVRRRIQDIKNEKRATKAAHERASERAQGTGHSRQADQLKKKISSLDEQLTDAYQEQKLYREKKVRPIHQQVTAEFIGELYYRYQKLCDSLRVTLVKSEGILEFDGLRIDYAHSRNSTWMPLKARDHSLVRSMHGRLRELVEKKGVHAVVESGHAGIGFKQLQKLFDHPEETNFKNNAIYDPVTAPSTVTFVVAMPFEDQCKISEIIKGRHPLRFSASKPTGSRKHHVIDRAKNDSVSGLTVLRRNGDGVLGTEWIEYDLFASGKALVAPAQYSLIVASSDEHIGSPEEDPMVRDGLVAHYDDLLRNPRTFRGKPALPRGFISGGDTSEANSRKWNDRYAVRRSPQEVLGENISLLTGFQKSGTNLEALVSVIMKMTNDSMQGHQENMRNNLDRVANYYDEFLFRNLGTSTLKYVHVSVPGNHADNVLRDLGLRESDFFMERHKDVVFEVGVPHYHLADPQKGRRAFIGGYSVARIGQIPDYGVDVDGKPLFGPINLLIQHDPKGSGFSGLVGAARSADADVALAGHTHENYVKVFKRADNKIGIAYRMSTLQGVTPIEKMYAYSVPRTQAGHQMIMPLPGYFYEEALPAEFLKQKGRRALNDRVKTLLATDGKKE